MKVMKKFRPPVDPRSFGSGLIVGCFLVSMTYVMMSKNQLSIDHLPICELPSLSSLLCSSRYYTFSNFLPVFSVNCLPSSSSSFNGVASVSSIVDRDTRVELSAIEMHENSSSAASASDVASEEEKFPSTDNESVSKEEEGISGRDVLEKSSTGDSNESGSEGTPERKAMCDFSEYRLNICDLEGDIRIIGKNLSSIMLVTQHNGILTSSNGDGNASLQIKPYPRKYDSSAMAKDRPLNLTAVHGDREAPRCTVNHTVPGIVFSTGGHCGNCFHDFADVLVPLFETAGPFLGQVQFIISNYQGWWMHKYRPYLMKLSAFDVIDYDNDDRVHCFEHVIVGLRAERDLMIDASRSAKGYSIMDFVDLTRSAYSLGRNRAWAFDEMPEKKPRLLFIARGGTRKFVNMNELVPMAEAVGFEVVVSEPDFFDVARFAHIVNSCDVMVGVHGAGLTNFLFLPTNAVVIQVVPLGKLDWIATNFYAEPAMGMQLRYLEYNISVDESTLVDLYPRDHPVFQDPESIHKEGWNKLGDVYLKQQNVKLDMKRFRPVIEKAFDLLHGKN
ncbi:hypothetical protein Cni_G02062 [Canna indica]|uniref:Glycosyltransferase 61 catalytic domain-containing protein n=1 Tax=Canna indica TaxID=4628 RepID=A0AAQ3JRU7_9LILI|nr:hypothetical protein Cni_G02062 [Canna indica]